MSEPCKCIAAGRGGVHYLSDHEWQPVCVCGNDLTVSEAENGWECAACRWETDQDARADQ